MTSALPTANDDKYAIAHGLPLYNLRKEPLLPIVVTHIAHLGRLIMHIQISKMHPDYPLVNCEVGGWFWKKWWEKRSKSVF
jgi:hypothetical protein